MPVAHYSCPLKSLKVVAVHPSVADLLVGLEAAAWHCWSRNDLCMHVHDEIHVMHRLYSNITSTLTQEITV